jgi:hypothetical protein
MTVLSRGARVRRGGRRPGWLLLTALLVLAIGASSALVFTNRVELLKLAVILALWAAVVAAFVSVIYRRQSDVDQARVRDLKLVYDLQLDREISARREYELTVESQLRRELASELRAQSADEVAALRAELAALRTNLEILFDIELSHRPALETERTTVRGYGDWAPEGESPPRDWVSSGRVTSVRRDDTSSRSDESSIIDVPEEPLLPPRQAATGAGLADEAYHAEEYCADAYEAAEAYQAAGVYRGSHWQQPEDRGWPTEERRPDDGWRAEGSYESQSQQRDGPQDETPPPQPEARFEPQREPSQSQPEPQPPQWYTEPAETPEATEWQPVGAEGQWLPPGTLGSDWVSSPADGVVDTANAANGSTAVSGLPPAATPPEQPCGRHASSAEPEVPQPREAEPGWQYGETGRRAQASESTEYDAHGTGIGAPSAPSPPPAPPPIPEVPDAASVMSPTPALAARHRSRDPSTDGNAPQSSGQSVADLLARLQAKPTGGGRRRRREE